LWGTKEIWGGTAPECRPVATGLICTAASIQRP